MALRESTTTISASSNTIISVTEDQRAQAVQGTQLTEVVQNLYSIALYDTLEDAVLVAAGLDPGSRTNNCEYFFRVPPKTHEFGEPFATTVTPTQGGGKYVESYGALIKSLKISGTTGLRPNKSTSASIPVLNLSEAQLQAVIGRGPNGLSTTAVRRIPADEKTGYDDIVFLRNIFRKYSDLKSDDTLSGRVVMLWRNLKDADYWIVEPEDFRLSQNSQSPLTYEYSITFKTLARFEFTYAMPPDPLAQARSTQRMLARVQEYGQNILNIFLVLSNQINRLQGYATFVSNTVLAPALGVLNGLNAIKTASYGVVRGLRTQVLTLEENLTVAIEQLATDPGFAGVFSPSPTPTVSPVLPAQDPIIRNLRRLSVICCRLLQEPIATESNTSDANLLIERYAAAYQTPGTLTMPRRAPADSPSYIGYEALTSTVGSDTVAPGETIRDVAERLLGDPSRWRILVTLNRLHSPYISATGGPGVLAPGDRILFPSSGPSDVSSSIVGTQNPTNDEYNGPNDPVVQAYGRDIMLKSTFVGGEELTDLAISQTGDLASIQGIPNVEQALKLKFTTERGELSAHPKYGAKYPVGKKATPSSFNELRINTLNTLSSDNRISRIRDLRFIAVGDKLAAKVDVELINARNIIPVTLALRRF